MEQWDYVPKVELVADDDTGHAMVLLAVPRDTPPQVMSALAAGVTLQSFDPEDTAKRETVKFVNQTTLEAELKKRKTQEMVLAALKKRGLGTTHSRKPLHSDTREGGGRITVQV